MARFPPSSPNDRIFTPGPSSSSGPATPRSTDRNFTSGPSSSPVADTAQRTRPTSLSWRFTQTAMHPAKPGPSKRQNAPTRWHDPKPGPTTRQNGSTHWRHGVLSGGILMDMLEQLSSTSRTTDWSMAAWLHERYIAPYGQVERLDGLIVESTMHMDTIRFAHERYVELIGERVKVQRLWVPGMEPTYEVPGGHLTSKPMILQGHTEQKIWRASDMYSKNRYEAAREESPGIMHTDEMGWDRHIRMAPLDHAEQSDMDSKGKTRAATGSTARDMNVKSEMSDTTESKSPPPGSDEIAERTYTQDTTTVENCSSSFVQEGSVA